MKKFRQHESNVLFAKEKSIQLTKFKQLANKCLAAFILLGNFIMLFPNANPVSAQQSTSSAQTRQAIVTVTADQPNIWTLEQAHYLLAQMHRRNLDLKAKGLTELDANQINGINIDVLRTLLEAGATYNEADRFNNNLIKQDKTFNTERRRQLIKDLDELQNESVNLTRIIARLKREKETAESEDKKAKIEAEIVEKTEIKGAVDGQIEQKRSELEGLSAASGSVSATSSSGAFNAQKFPTSGFDATFQKKAAEIIDSFKTNPQLNASLQLDNFLQLQYEIISKQLTLLRDEVGPGERLIFLELPQSVNATNDKSDDMWAQSRWRIAGFTRCEMTINNDNNNKSVPCHKILDSGNGDDNLNRPPRTTLDLFDSLVGKESSVPDKIKLTVYDIRNRQKLAGKFVVDKEDLPDENNPQKDTPLAEYGNRNAAIFFGDSLKKNAWQGSEKQLIENYKTILINFVAAKKNLKDQLGALDNCGANEDCKIKEQAKVEIAEKALAKIQEDVESPSYELLNLITNKLNEAINSNAQLNSDGKLNEKNQSKRTLLLNRINPDPETKRLLNRLWIEDLFSDEIFRLQERDFPSKYVNLSSETKIDNQIKIDNRIVRTVEMIPRQSSFNINDVKIRNKSGAFNFIASFLFGFGANLNYQQQRERYSQFVQQELYSSAFGKGSREFGWTFTSMPGTDRLLSGVRTTYAIVVVPQEATSIVLESTGCAFDRRAQQPRNFDDAIDASWKQPGRKNSCSAEAKNFVIPIPGGGFDSSNDFYVSGLTYEPVEKGKRIVVSIYGNNFSSQIGVMINGVPLPASIGIAQNYIRDDSVVGGIVRELTKSEKVRGGFERVDSNQIVASFELVDSEMPTPIITLVSPGKAVDLNSLSNLYINRQRSTSLKDSEWMFGTKPKSNFRVTNAQVFVSKVDTNNKPTELTALITGASFNGITSAFVNGIDPAEYLKHYVKEDPNCQANCILICPVGGKCGERGWWGQYNIYRLKFPPPEEDKINIILVNGDEVIKLDPITNPAKAKAEKVPPKPTQFNFEVKEVTAYYSDAKKEKVSNLLVELTGGTDLTSGMNVSLGQYDFSGTDSTGKSKAYITISDPKPAQTIRLTSPDGTKYMDIVVTLRDIKPVPQPTSSPSATPSSTPTP